MSLTVCQTVTLRTGEVVLAERRNTGIDVPSFGAPLPLVLAAGTARVACACLAIGWKLALWCALIAGGVLAAVGAGLHAGARHLLEEDCCGGFDGPR